MQTIHKFHIPITDKFDLIMPQESEIMTVQLQNDEPYIWAVVDVDEKEVETRHFQIIGIGNPIDTTYLIYIGTFQMPPFVWHLFEDCEKQIRKNDV